MDGDRTGLATQVEFAVEEPAYPFVELSETEDCEVELAELLPRRERYAEFFNVLGAEPDRVLEHVEAESEVVPDASLVAEYEDSYLFEFLVPGSCPVVELARRGAVPREARGEGGEGRIVAEIPPRLDPSEVVEPFLEGRPAISLAAKQRAEALGPLFSRSAVQEILAPLLTERQREVLRAAVEAGYYEWPRECTGAEVADRLDISSATFSEHIRAAERKLIRALLKNGE